MKEGKEGGREREKRGREGRKEGRSQGIIITQDGPLDSAAGLTPDKCFLEPQNTKKYKGLKMTAQVRSWARKEQ